MKFLTAIFLSFILTSFSCASSLTLDFDNVSLSDALQTIAKFMKINLILSSEISGQVSLHLAKLPPNEALNLLLTSHDLFKWQSGHSWIVGTRASFIQKQQELLKLKEINEAADPLFTEVWPMHYAKAEEVAKLLTTKRGAVRVDGRTNSLCVQETKLHLHEMHQIVRRIDIPVQQVLIRARLASIDTDFEKHLGLHFDATQSGGDEASFPRYALAIARLVDGSLLDVKLAALEQAGHGELISSPSLFTANQQTASIESGEEIPYQQVSRSGGTGIAFKKAVLSLKVTPQIMPNGRVLLQLSVNQDKPANRIVLGVPAISTRQISTNVLVKNGQTIVLGGIYEATKEEGVERLPFLSKLPLVGVLFQEQNRHDTKRELLVFVTPEIIL